MANKRPPLSFPELEGRGRGAILRTSAEIAAEQSDPDDVASGNDNSSSAPSMPDTVAAPSAQDNAPMRARVRARTNQNGVLAAADELLNELSRRLQSKSRLSTYSLRFRSTELEELDKVVEQINQSRSQKVSKNDLARLALNCLLQDYAEKGRESVLARVLARI